MVFSLVYLFFLWFSLCWFPKPPTWMQTTKVCMNDDDEFGQGFNLSHCMKASVVLPWTLYLLEWSFAIFYLIPN